MSNILWFFKIKIKNFQSHNKQKVIQTKMNEVKFGNSIKSVSYFFLLLLLFYLVLLHQLYELHIPYILKIFLVLLANVYVTL